MNAALSCPTQLALVLRNCTAQDLMAPNPISLRADAGADEAMQLFLEKGIAAAPVINDAGVPIGVVSRSDILIHQRQNEKSAETAATSTGAKKGAPCTVADLMTPAVFVVAVDTPVKQIVKDMLGLHVHRLFVVDADGILVGVISTMDVLKHLQPDE